MPETKSLFNRVAEHYDLLNTLLSFGMDRSWRRRLAEEITSSNLVLDIATGTADVAIEVVKKWNGCFAIGIDPSKQMLDLAHTKLETARVKKKVALVEGFAEDLPFKNGTFDAITIAFGIRNTIDPLISLKEMNRVLKPSGRAGILEFALPRNRLFAPLYMSYIRNMFPFLGSFFGKKNEYQYLVDSIPTFPQRDGFTRLMEEAGFSVIKPIELTMGTVIIYVGVKDD
ncbi:MAG TPA: bifunctional demethylmenaquinone methyltransferase/2-methoxy-6-polyprenyl-1,4-benzoquinol methylase UbiE [Thermodesulfobacteriota bacterium]|nr:bifunctional demethylmenaquinone methyltransferase/2-methoxy-6-polyprenyl-1,4-benzoquinol methylase UbiE [Thermodesulfobacteriota bacterium]